MLVHCNSEVECVCVCVYVCAHVHIIGATVSKPLTSELNGRISLIGASAASHTLTMKTENCLYGVWITSTLNWSTHISMG